MAERKKGKTTGRPCSICTHRQVSQINTAVLEGVSFRSISLKNGMSDVSVHRHVQNCLKLDIQALRAEQKKEIAFDFAAELHNLYAKAQKMVAALEKWLVDTENPDEFDIGPRDSEILVTYLDYLDKTEQGKPRRKKEVLSELLARAEGESKEVIGVASMAVDNRKLYLEAFKTLNDRLEQIAKFYGLYQKDRTNEADVQKLANEITDRLIAKGWKAEDAHTWVANNLNTVTQAAGVH